MNTMIYYGSNDYRDYLAHHGVLGMHWGIRRYQPYSIGYQRKGGESGKFVGGKGKSSSGKLVGGSSGPATASNSSNDSSKSGWERRKEEKNALGKTRADSVNTKGLEVARAALNAALLNPLPAAFLSYKLYKEHKGKQFVKENLQRLSQNTNVDKKTGLKLKNEDFSPDDDVKYVNPEYHDFDVNTKQNCMLCTTAYELRRRGYDVQANKALFGYPYDAVKDWFPKAEVKQLDSLNKNDPQAVTQKAMQAAFGNNHELAESATTALLKQGEGARGNLIVNFSNGGGHSVTYEVSKGNVIVRDCQSGKIYRNTDEVKKKLLRYCITASAARLDDVDFDPEAIKEAVK